MIAMTFRRFPTLFARLMGRNGAVREYNALLSPASDYSIIPMVDAFRLGYSEAARSEPVTEPQNLFRGVTFPGFWEGTLITVKEVSAGGASLPNVDFIAYDIPQVSGFDVVLGRSFLAPSRLRIDYSDGTVSPGRSEAA